MIKNITDTFIKNLPSDIILENTRRQVLGACYSYVSPQKTKKPELIHVAKVMAKELGIEEDLSTTTSFLNIVTGNELLKNTTPYAMCYGGHQFGNWAGQLGDGRAINLTEMTHNNKQWT